MFDSHKYRTRPDVSRCRRFLPRKRLKNVSIIMLFSLLLEIIPVQHLSHWEARGNDKALDVRRSLKCFERAPKAPKNTPPSPWSSSRGKYMFAGSNSVFHHALIPLAPQNWAGHYSCSRTQSQCDVCQALPNLIEHTVVQIICWVISSKLQRRLPS